jgi:RNA polymerase sigma factor (sigma-70 family)
MLENFDQTIVKLAKTYNIPPLEWQDIAQELRLHLWENRNKYDKSKGSYEDWAYIVCRNKIRDLARQYNNEPISLDEIQEKGFDIGYNSQTEDRIAEEEQTNERLSELTPKQREVAKKVLSKDKQEDIADDLEITRQAVSDRFNRGLRRLKDE